jgi:hypothetical protein
MTWLVFIAAFALLAVTVAWRNSRLAAAVVAAAGIFVHPFPDPVFVAYPLLTALAVLSTRWGGLEKTAAAFGLSFCALATPTKFLVAPAAAAMFILCDTCALARRRLPVYTVAFVLLCFGLFALNNGPDSFLPYVFSSFKAVPGYSEAVLFDRAHQEIIVFVITAATLLAAAGSMEVRAARQPDCMKWIAYLRWLVAILRWLVLAGCLCLMFEEGFATPDEHSLQAWSGLAIAALVYSLIFRGPHTYYVVRRLVCAVLKRDCVIARRPAGATKQSRASRAALDASRYRPQR